MSLLAKPPAGRVNILFRSPNLLVGSGGTAGNKNFAQDIAAWTFQESLVLKVDNATHYLASDPTKTPRDMYTINEQIVSTPRRNFWFVRVLILRSRHLILTYLLLLPRKANTNLTQTFRICSSNSPCSILTSVPL